MACRNGSLGRQSEGVQRSDEAVHRYEGGDREGIGPWWRLLDRGGACWTLVAPIGLWWRLLDPGGGGYPTLAIAGREGRIVIPRSSTLTLASG